MKISNIYTCELCGKEWHTEEGCKACEANHLANGRIVKTKYVDGSSQPMELIVDFEGTKASYVFNGRRTKESLDD